MSQIPIINLSTFENSTSSKFKHLKSALIIQNEGTSNFISGISECMKAFTQDQEISLIDDDYGEVYNWKMMTEEDEDLIFKKVDLVAQSDLFNKSHRKSFFRNYDLIILTSYLVDIKDWDDEMPRIINELIEEEGLAILFMRGCGTSEKLGFVNNRNNKWSGYVPYASGEQIQLLMHNIYQMNQNQFILQFLKKYETKLFKISDQNSGTIMTHCLDLGDECLCGIKPSILTNENDWHFLAQHCEERDKFNWIIHKRKKVMFTPWYGYSFGNCGIDLTLYALKFLLFEHLKFKQVFNQVPSNSKFSDIFFQFID